jgi:uncharacterized protein (DUF2384 family)
MPVITEQRATALEREATVRPLGELAGYLQEALGQRMAAHLAGLEHAKQIGRYARGAATPRNDLTVRRIREGYKVVRMLVDAYDATTAKAWLFGTNTRLDDRAPVDVLGLGTASEDFAAVVRAARQFSSADE